MSADNGFIIRQRNDGEFTLQEYSASADDYPPIYDATPEEVFPTLEAAVMHYAEMQQKAEEAGTYLSEYGLSVYTPIVKKDVYDI